MNPNSVYITLYVYDNINKINDNMYIYVYIYQHGSIIG